MGCGDFGPLPSKSGWGHDLVIRRSTDNGHSWGQLKPCSMLSTSCPGRRSEPRASLTTATRSGIQRLWDSATDTVWLFFNGPGREDADCQAGLCSTWETHSTDKGASWTTPTNMTLQCQRPGARAGLRAANTPGNGHGVQLSSGRLVVPMYGGVPAGRAYATRMITVSRRHLVESYPSLTVFL